MVSLQAIIPNESEAFDIDLQPPRNNISQDLSKANGVDEPFLLGVTTFKEKRHFVSEQSSAFISRAISDSEGNFSESQDFVIITSNAKFVKISFDTYNDEYPPEIICTDGDNQTTAIEVNSPTIIIPIKNNYLWLEISKWNKPNRPLLVSNVSLSIVIDQIIDCQINNQDRSDASLPSWGLKYNTGTLDFVDTYNMVSQLQKIGEFGGYQIIFYLKAPHKTERIGVFYVSTGSHDITNFTSKIEFQDFLSYFQNEKGEEHFISPPMSLYDFFAKVVNSSNIRIKIADTMTEQRLKDITISYPLISGGSIWEQLRKICEVGLCYISCDKKGEAYIKYDRGA